MHHNCHQPQQANDLMQQLGDIVKTHHQQKKQWNYDVTASPKTEPKNIRKDTKEDVPDFHQNKTDEEDYVDYVPTGDVPVLLIALGVAAGAAVLLAAEKRKKTKG